MKEKIALAVIVAALSGAAFAETTQSQDYQQPGATGTSSESYQQPGAPSSTGLGQSGMEQGVSFDQLDQNGDGNISKDEWSKLDTNSDGKVDNAEFAQFEVEGSSQGTSTEESSGTSQ